MVLNPNLTFVKELESEFILFINDNNPSVVDDVTRHMLKKLGGLGMIDINLFWQALRMSWLRRQINSNATWAKLHRDETIPFTFNPISSNYEDLLKAKTVCKNSFWKDIYASLLLCRRNVLNIHPEEFITLPINREPQITKKHSEKSELVAIRGIYFFFLFNSQS